MTFIPFEELVAERAGGERRIASVRKLMNACAYLVECKDDCESVIVSWKDVHAAGLTEADFAAYLVDA